MQPLLVLCCGGDFPPSNIHLADLFTPPEPNHSSPSKKGAPPPSRHHPTNPPTRQKKNEPTYHRQTDKSKTKMCTPSPHLNPVQKTEEWTMPELNRRPFTRCISHHVILSDNAEAKMRSENHTTRPIALVSDGVDVSLFCLLLVQCGGGHDSRCRLVCKGGRQQGIGHLSPSLILQHLRMTSGRTRE